MSAQGGRGCLPMGGVCLGMLSQTSFAGGKDVELKQFV